MIKFQFQSKKIEGILWATARRAFCCSESINFGYLDQEI